MAILNGNLNVYSEPDTGENVQGASTVESTATSADGYLNSQVVEGNDTTSEPEVKETTKGTWRDQLPKEMRDSAGLVGFKTVGELAKAYLAKDNAVEEKKDSNFLAENVSEKEWDGFKDKVAEVADPSGGITRSIIKVAKDVGIKPAQAKAIMDGLTDLESEMRAQSGAACESAMRAIWGNAYDVNRADALSGFTKVINGDEAFENAVKSAGLVNSPIVVEICRRVGNLLKEPKDGFIGGTQEVKNDVGEDLYGTNLFKRK